MTEAEDSDADARSMALAALLEVDLSSRVNMRVLAGTNLVAALVLQLSRFKTPLHWITTALLLFTVVYALVVERKLRRGALGPWDTLGPGVACATSVLAATALLGPISAVCATLPALVFAWGHGASLPSAWGVYLTSAVGYLVVAVLAMVGVIPLTHSVLALTHENHRALVGLTIFFEMLLAVCFWLGRGARQTLNAAIEGVEHARHELHRRRALLDETQAELRMVLDAAKRGPFSGRDVGPYQAAEVIGRGAMGEIYRAVHRESGQLVALKVLQPTAREDQTSVQRFLREAEVSSSLESPHIVAVLGNGTTLEGHPYLAMELLTGVDLARHLRAEGRLSLDETIELVDHIARALAVAEQHGIVHRDLKPPNVFRTIHGKRPVWKLLDFGVSKLRETAGTLTQGAAVGTPSYMSPEQVSGRPVDHRSDVFALGAIAYRALTGRPAFGGSEGMSIMYKILHDQPIQPSSLADLATDVDLVFSVALAKDRKLRFATALELAAALGDASRGKLSDALRERARQLLSRAPWRKDSEEDPTEDSPAN